MHFILSPAIKAHKGRTGVAAFSFFNLGRRWTWVVNATPRPLYPGKGPVPIILEAVLVLRPVWKGVFVRVGTANEWHTS
jgi:hypothetical protein